MKEKSEKPQIEKDYFNSMPSHPAIQSLFNSIHYTKETNEPSLKTNAIDTSRFRLNEPTESHATEAISSIKTPKKSKTSKPHLDQWDNATNNAFAQLEQQVNRIENLELMNQFGANKWKLYNFQLETIANGIQREIEKLKHEEKEIEKQRFFDQVSFFI